MTPTQMHLYSFIAQYWEEFGYGPTYDAIILGTHLKSKGAAHAMVARMVAEGALEAAPGQIRSIKCVPLKDRTWHEGYAAGWRDAMRNMGLAPPELAKLEPPREVAAPAA